MHHAGAVRKDLSDLFVSNDEVFGAVKRSPKLLAGISIHPARPDALDELERCAAAGAVLLKLLPCVQNVDCNLTKYKMFWTRLADLGLPLLAHTGGEFFVRSCRNDLKSPLCLRLPLECGVTVIAAHCSTRALPIRNPLEKKIELTRALGFPERVFTDLWDLIPILRLAA
jgi:predicted TIM-barrel fold metal-dependent hydrolase